MIAFCYTKLLRARIYIGASAVARPPAGSAFCDLICRKRPGKMLIVGHPFGIV
jgi:hypothetical protein